MIERHYDERPRQTEAARRSSKTYRIRRDHNRIKRALIDRYVPRRARVLDLCCGKGGDLLKYRDLAEWVGVDVSAGSIAEGQRRAEGRVSFPTRWVRADLLAPWAFGAHGVDVVSMQFALHYLCGSEAALGAALDGIAARLRPGGVFLATFPDDVALLRLWRAHGAEVEVDADAGCRIVFADDRMAGLEASPFGVKYQFYLGECVDGAPEHVVHRPTLRRMADERGLVEILSMPFADLVDDPSPTTRLYRAVAYRNERR